MNKTSVVTIMLLVVSCSTANRISKSEDESTTVPFVLDHNRVTVEAVFNRPDGSNRPARAWIDTGGTAVVISEKLARELGVDLEGMPEGGEHSWSSTTPVPRITIGDMPLDCDGGTFSVYPGRFARPGVQSECTIPARCLRKLRAVFDYPSQELTLARSGGLIPRGTAVPCRVNSETGLFMVETTIDGEKVALGVDTGSSGTWVSNELVKKLLDRHADRRSVKGSVGSTNFFGFPFETEGTLLDLPAMTIGAVSVEREIAVLGLDHSIFDWYSEKSAGPVAGFVGGDLLADFRLEVDFLERMTWWEYRNSTSKKRDLDIVGLTLRAENDGAFSVAGVVMRGDQPVVQGVLPGDKLLSVDNLDATAAPMGTVIDALRGTPGDVHTLTLERNGDKIITHATVMRLP